MITFSMLAKTVGRWLPFAALITILCGFGYVSVQQNYRQSANDPQIQMAEDGAVALGNGASIDSLFTNVPAINLATSLLPYVMVFDTNHQLIKSSMTLKDASVVPPSGVFTYVDAQGEDRVTWQTATGERSALVVTKVTNNDQVGYIAAGRSLREVEHRESALTDITVMTWAVGLVIVYLILLFWPEKKAA